MHFDLYISLQVNPCYLMIKEYLDIIHQQELVICFCARDFKTILFYQYQENLFNQNNQSQSNDWGFNLGKTPLNSGVSFDTCFFWEIIDHNVCALHKLFLSPPPPAHTHTLDIFWHEDLWHWNNDKKCGIITLVYLVIHVIVVQCFYILCWYRRCS